MNRYQAHRAPMAHREQRINPRELLIGTAILFGFLLGIALALPVIWP